MSNTDLDKFIIGKSGDENIYISQEKVHFLKEFSHLKRMQCQGCFAEFNCSGGCISKKVIKDEIVEESVKIKCEITKEILLHEVTTVLEKGLSY